MHDKCVADMNFIKCKMLKDFEQSCKDILSNMTNVDKATLEKLHEIISTAENTGLSADAKVKLYTEMIDSFIKTAEKNRLNFAEDIKKIDNVGRNLRKFKPLFLHAVQVTYNYMDNLGELYEMIDNQCTLGVDGFIVTTYLKWDGLTLEHLENKTALEEICNFIKSRGKRVWALKVHCTTYDESEEFKTAYKEKIEFLAEISRDNAERFIIFNECSLLHGDAHEEWVLDVVNTAKTISGQKVSSSMAVRGVGVDGFNADILSALDFLCVNYYQEVGEKGKATTYEDCLTAWTYSNLLPIIKTLKYKYPTKEIYVSEVGIMDYFDSYKVPENWNITTGGRANGETVKNYLKAFFDVFDGNVDGVCSWYEIFLEKAIPMIKMYMGVLE